MPTATVQYLGLTLDIDFLVNDEGVCTEIESVSLNGEYINCMLECLYDSRGRGLLDDNGPLFELCEDYHAEHRRDDDYSYVDEDREMEVEV